MLNLNWNYKNGEQQPFTELKDEKGNDIKYRGKQIVEHKGNLYTIQEWYWNHNPQLDNNVILKSVTKKCEETLKEKIFYDVEGNIIKVLK